MTRVWRIFTGATMIETVNGKPPKFCWMDEAVLHVPDMPKKQYAGFQVDMGPAGIGFIPLEKVDLIAVQEVSELTIVKPGSEVVLRRNK